MDYWVWIVVAVFILIVIGIIAYLWYQSANNQPISSTTWWIIIAVLVVMIIIIVLVAVFAGGKKPVVVPRPVVVAPLPPPVAEVNNYDTAAPVPMTQGYTLVAQQPQMMVAQQPAIDLIATEGGYIPPPTTGLVPGVGGRSTVNMQPRTIVVQQPVLAQQPMMVQQGLRRTGVTANGIQTQASVTAYNNGATSFNPDPVTRVQTIPQQTFRASVLENGVPKTGTVRTGGGTRIVTQDQLPHQVQVIG